MDEMACIGPVTLITGTRHCGNVCELFLHFLAYIR